MIQVIKASIKHTELIAEIGKQSFLDSHKNCASKEELNHFVNENYTSKALLEELKNSKYYYHVIYLNNIAVGFSKIELDTPYKNEHDSGLAKLDRIYLLKEYHGKGLGAKLLEFNIQFSKTKKQNGIWLFTWVENKRAINFYLKEGFTVVGKHDYKISETHSNPNHIMYLMYT